MLIMLNPAIGKLIENSENRYGLVTEIAACARKIATDAQENEEIILLLEGNRGVAVCLM